MLLKCEKHNNYHQTPLFISLYSPCYRYGFNGKEVDEVAQGVYDLGARHYDARIGRMFSSDPREAEYPWQSTYAYYANNPTNEVDVNGEGGELGLRTQFGISTRNFKNYNLRTTLVLGYSSDIEISSNSRLIGRYELASSFYFGGQGTQVGTNKFGYDISAIGTATLGYKDAGENVTANLYTLNHNTISPFEDDNSYSITHGQMLNYNSGIGKTTRIGLIALKTKNFSLSYGNDAVLPPTFGGGTDRAWQYAVLQYKNSSNVEIVGGHSMFGGNRIAKQASLSCDTYCNESINKDLYLQLPSQQKLNSAYNFLSVNGLGVGWYGSHWLQDFIHTRITNEAMYESNEENYGQVMEFQSGTSTFHNWDD